MNRHPLELAVFSILLTLFAVVILLILGTVFLAPTGPNCPGADPAWLGWCASAPPAAGN